MPASTDTQDSITLVPLREDLTLHRASPDRDGAARYLIEDPLRHRNFMVGVQAFELLSLWHCGSSDLIVAKLAGKYPEKALRDAISKTAEFLSNNGLLDQEPAGGWQGLEEQVLAAKRSPISWLIHNYLFVRIPLARPQKFLDSTKRFVAIFYSRTFLLFIVLTGLVALFLVSRQWHEFSSSLAQLLSLEGMVTYAVVLFLVKAFHELGHAYTAARFGCRVPTMGVAFLVMYPMLYTDVSDAWRLTDKRQRLLVDSAGVIAEFIVAVIATVLWVFLPDGIARDVCLVLATISWAMTLLINMNPFMRFDGYYFLSDLLEVENLGPRSFELGKWRLRECLFGLQHPAPEAFSPTMRRTLIAYAYITWIYRLFLFIGIALLVYALFFKALGIALFVIEIAFFVLVPVFRELKVWYGLRQQIFRRWRIGLVAMVCAGLAAGIVVPWQSTIIAPATMKSSVTTTVHAPWEGKITSIGVSEGDTVSVGDVLIEIESQELKFQHSRAQREKDLIMLRLARIGAGQLERTNKLVLEERLQRVSRKLQGLDASMQKLTIIADINGVVVRLPVATHTGAWIGQDQALLHIVDPQAPMLVSAAIDEHSVIRMAPGAKAKFVPENLQLSTTSATLESIAPTAVESLSSPYLSSHFGGPINATLDASDNHIVNESVFMAKLGLAAQARGEQLRWGVHRGVVHIEAQSESLLRRAFTRVLGVFIREASA